VIALDVGPILDHVTTCPVCASYVSTRPPTGTKADYDGLCDEGTRLLVSIDTAMAAQGYTPRGERGEGAPS